MSMFSKFQRSVFYNKEEVNDVLERDLIMNRFDLFEIKRPASFFTITRTYLGRPELLSLKLYGTMDYWWILAKLNQLDDWWNDIHIGDVIQVPDINDIEDFYLSVRLLISD